MKLGKMSFYASAIEQWAACAVDVDHLALAGCRRLRRLSVGPGAKFDVTCLEGSGPMELCYDGNLDEAPAIFGEVLAGLKGEVLMQASNGVHVRKGKVEMDGVHTLSNVAEAPVLRMDARVIILSEVDDLSERGLRGSRSLASVILSKSAAALPNGFFAECLRLASLNIAECRSLVRIGNQCFMRCASLRHLSFPSSLRIIGESAFWESALDSAMLDDARALEGCDLSGCLWMREVRIPAGYRGECCLSGSGRVTTVTAAVVPKRLPLVESFRCMGMCFPYDLRNHICCRNCFAFGEIASLMGRACRPFLPC
jgi:hypothetical protein